MRFKLDSISQYKFVKHRMNGLSLFALILMIQFLNVSIS